MHLPATTVGGTLTTDAKFWSLAWPELEASDTLHGLTLPASVFMIQLCEHFLKESDFVCCHAPAPVTTEEHARIEYN